MGFPATGEKLTKTNETLILFIEFEEAILTLSDKLFLGNSEGISICFMGSSSS